MKIRKDKEVLVALGAALLMIAIGVASWVFDAPIFFDKPVYMAVALICSGIVVALIGVDLARRSKEELVRDERCIKNVHKAGFVAFWIMIAMLLIIPIFGKYSSFPINESLLVICIGLYSFMLLMWHYNRKGDVE